MNRRTRSMQFSTERVASAELGVIGLRVRVSGRANVLKFRFRDRRFVSWQYAGGAAGFATAEEKDCEESRENG